jgi:type III secretory pathway component EscV
LALDPNVAGALVDAIRSNYARHAHLKQEPVLITQMDVRRYVRSIIEKELPFIHVLSFQEVEAHVQFNSLGVIDMEASP